MAAVPAVLAFTQPAAATDVTEHGRPVCAEPRSRLCWRS